MTNPYNLIDLQVLLNYYYDFHPKKLRDDNRMSYLKGLEVLTQNFLPGQNLGTMSVDAFIDLVKVAVAERGRYIVE